jgi:hypothetical protein
MQRTFSGAPSGKGSVYEWRGNKNIGHGRMEIRDDTFLEDRHQTGFLQPVRSAQHGGVHHAPERQHDQCDLGDARSGPFMAKIIHIFKYGSHGRRPVSAGTVSMKAVAEK